VTRSAADRTRAAAERESAELANNEVLQMMWNTIENGGYDFMSKDDW